MNTTAHLAAARAAHDAAQQACATASRALAQATADRQAAIASAAPAARLDAADKAIRDASRQVEISDAARKRASAALRDAEQAADSAEVERLRAERLDLVCKANAAAELVEQHVADARAASTRYSAAMQSLAHFTSLHASRLRLPPFAGGAQISVAMTVPGWAGHTAPLARIPRL